MRIDSVHSIKHTCRSALQSLPRQGSRTRAIYDFFHQNKGKVVQISFDKQNSTLVHRLRIEYGMDLRCLRQGHRYLEGEWIFAGEYDGPNFIDYVHESFHPEP